jgi:hypothetical protein
VSLYSVTTARRVAMVTRNQYGGRHTVSARLAVEFSVNVFLSCISCSRFVYILATWESLMYKVMATTDCCISLSLFSRDQIRGYAYVLGLILSYTNSKCVCVCVCVVLPALTVQNSAFYPHSVFIRFVRFS